MSLSDVACRSAKPEAKQYKMSDAGGLYLLVKPNGSRLWQMKYRFVGKEKTLSLGKYPEVTLAEAREGRDQARKLLTQNKDPSLAKQEAKQLAAIHMANTFQQVALEWHKKQKSMRWTEAHANTVLRRLELDVFPAIGKVPVKDVTTARLAKVIEDIQARGAHDVARRALQYCQKVFTHAAIHGLIAQSPATFKPSDIISSYKKGHFAAMDAKQLPEFVRKLHRNEARLFHQTQLAMELLLLTFVRTNELIKARWEEFDLDKALWVIPASRMKMKRDHMVPLASQSVAIVRELKELYGHRPYVFPGQRNPRSHMSNGAILMALDRMGYRGVHTGHGFRALAMSTLLEELGYTFDVVDVQLAHGKKSEIAAAYNRAQYLPQRTKMMQDWADYIHRMK